MPSERPQLSPIGEQLRARAVAKNGPMAAVNLSILLALPGVKEAAGSEDKYRLAMAFEDLLARVADELDGDFLVERERFVSPSWIARGLFQLETGWPGTITERRKKILGRYKGDADDFRQRYEKQLLNFVGLQLQEARASPSRVGTVPESSWPDRFDWWADNLKPPAYAFYSDLERGLHDPFIGGGKPVVRADELLGSLSAFLEAENRDWRGVALHEGTPEGDLALAAGHIVSRIRHWLNDFDRKLLADERERALARGLGLYEALGQSESGERIVRLWEGFLASCDCGCTGARDPENYEETCAVHAVVADLERLLLRMDPEFYEGWLWRTDVDDSGPEPRLMSKPEQNERFRNLAAADWPSRGLDRFIHSGSVID